MRGHLGLHYHKMQVHFQDVSVTHPLCSHISHQMVLRQIIVVSIDLIDRDIEQRLSFVYPIMNRESLPGSGALFRASAMHVCVFVTGAILT